MADDEPFLSRWSRLKREAREEPPPEAPAEEPAEPATNPVAEEAPEPFDPATLPPVESLGADSDYTAFLAPEVPQELRLMALRKAWVSDPVIANFRGFAEYDWDCNAPGYAQLLPTDKILDMVESIVGEDPVKEPVPEAAPLVASTEAESEEAPEDVPSPLRGEGERSLPSS
ncbi:DUF3306 domain-containing protein [Azospirillum sp. sgz302134]